MVEEKEGDVGKQKIRGMNKKEGTCLGIRSGPEKRKTHKGAGLGTRDLG